MIIKFFESILTLPESRLKDYIRGFFYRNVISERILEYTAVTAYLNTPPSLKVKIFDIGCLYSNFPLQLASMGYDVTAIDLSDYPLRHPNFKFIKGDLLDYPIPKNHFDIVTSISTLEHIGVGFYDKRDDLSADRKIVEIVRSILKKNGRFLLTVPFGKKSVNSLQRVYDYPALLELLKGFKIETALFYKEIKGKWRLVKKEEAAKVRSTNVTNAVAFISAKVNK